MPIEIDLFFQKLLAKAITSQASDLILTVGNLPTVKIKQKLVVLEDFEVVTPTILNSFLESILTKKEQGELEEKKYLSVVKDFKEDMRFRINIFYQRGFPSLEMRYISVIIPPLLSLGFPKALEQVTNFKSGLVIVGGPYGSGRTTVVASFLDFINQKQNKHIITLEKPIEYLFTSNKSVVEQREVEIDIGSFLQGLESLRDIDVDVVFVSQLNSTAEYQQLLEVIEGGRLAFLVVEAESVQKILEKIIDLFPFNDKDRIWHSLADLLRCVLVLRLLPKIGEGVVLASEIMINNQATAALVRDGRFYQLLSVISTSRQEGMRSLDQHLAELVSSGKVEFSCAEKEALDKNNFRSLVKR